MKQEVAGSGISMQSTLGRQTEGPARPARGLRSQASGCLEPADQGGSSGTSRGTAARTESRPTTTVHSRDGSSRS